MCNRSELSEDAFMIALAASYVTAFLLGAAVVGIAWILVPL